MIEVTIRRENYREYLVGLKVGEPDEYRYGVAVHHVIVNDVIGLDAALRAGGLRKVGYDVNYLAEVYTGYPVDYMRLKLAALVVTGYWRVMWWLYLHGRLFQELPAGVRLSWRYFTLYAMFKRGKGKKK